MRLLLTVFLSLALLQSCNSLDDTGIANISIVNDTSQQISLGIDRSARENLSGGGSLYDVPKGATRRFVHCFEMDSATTKRTAIVYLEVRGASKVDLGRYEAKSGTDDDEGDVSSVFADGKKGLDALDIKCRDDGCTINGTKMDIQTGT